MTFEDDSWQAFEAAPAPAGLLGFTFTPPDASPGGDVVTFTKMVLNASSTSVQTWTVNLAAWQASNGRGRNSTGIESLAVRVTWGGGGAGGSATEVVLMDYPAAGTAFNVHGTQVSVELVGSVAPQFRQDQLPILGGWLTHGRSDERIMAATLTERFVEVATGQGAVFNVPPRARSYRLVTRSVDDNSIEVLQQSGNSTPRDEAVQFPVVIEIPGFSFLPANVAAAIPLMPDTQMLVVTPLVGVAVRIQWLLEMG